MRTRLTARRRLLGLLLAMGLLASVIGAAGAMGATSTRRTVAAPSSPATLGVAGSNSDGLLTFTPAASQDRPFSAPVARAAVTPLAVPVAQFIFKELAVGVLNKAGGEAFGRVLSEVGFEDQGAKTQQALKEVNVKLEEIKASMSELNSKVDGLSASLAFARLSGVRTSVRDLVGRIDDAAARLQQLSSGKITDPTLRREKRAELLEIIKTKLLTEQNTLDQAIASSQGNDDISHMAFLAERTKTGRFWSDDNWRRASEIVSYYRDEAAQLLLLRIEYEYSSVKQNSSPLYVTERKAIAQDMVDKQVAQNGRFNDAIPVSLLGNHSTVIDSKPGPDGKLQVWVNDSRFNQTVLPLGESAPNEFQDKYPSLAEFRHLVSGRGSQSTTDYLRSQGFILPLSCTRASTQRSAPAGPQTVFWTRDIAGGGRRWAWGEHDDGQGQLAWACGNIRVRDLYPWQHFF
ncbi:MAG: hypothetical protein WAK93_10895 [Solirubrobacteraceae bacterium]